MKTLLVGYDLNKSGQDYEDIWAYLNAQSSWWHHLDSTWLIRTELTAVQLRDAIAEIGLDANDELLVIDVSGDAAAWKGFHPRGSKWLKDNL